MKRTGPKILVAKCLEPKWRADPDLPMIQDTLQWRSAPRGERDLILRGALERTTRSRSGYWPPRPYRPLPRPTAGAACFRFARPLLRRSGRGRRTRDEEANTTDRTSLMTFGHARVRALGGSSKMTLRAGHVFTRTRSARRYPGWKKEWEPRDPDPRVSVGSVEVQGDDSWTDDKPVIRIDRPTILWGGGSC